MAKRKSISAIAMTDTPCDFQADLTEAKPSVQKYVAALGTVNLKLQTQIAQLQAHNLSLKHRVKANEIESERWNSTEEMREVHNEMTDAEMATAQAYWDALNAARKRLKVRETEV